MFDFQDQLYNPIRTTCRAGGTTVPVKVVDGFGEPVFYGRRLCIVVGAGWLIENRLA